MIAKIFIVENSYSNLYIKKIKLFMSKYIKL